jgi:SAM-dependent methyltransferase
MRPIVKRTAKALGFHGPDTGGMTPTGINGPILQVFSAIWTRINVARHASRSNRMLEIGPGGKRLAGFETVNFMFGRHIDYVCDATKRLPFTVDTFEVIYASHILEHTPWYQTQDVLREWIRILRPGGWLEIWVPNGLAICKAFVDAETEGLDPLINDPWTRFNEQRDPCRWASGRIFTYGDGSGRINDPNWHRAMFSPRYLRNCLEEAGLEDVTEMDRSEVRGYDHGWINLGMKGRKPG